MMRRASVQHAEMDIGAGGLREALKEIFGQLGLEIADEFRGDLGVADAVGSATEIDGGCGQRFVHRHQEISGAQDAALVAEGLHDRFTERDASIFDGVMLIDVEIAFRFQTEIEGAMTRDEIEHVIEKANAGRNARRAAAVQIDAHANIGFVGLAMERWRFWAFTFSSSA